MHSPKIQDKINGLKLSRVLQSLPPAEIEHIAHLSQHQIYDPKDFIFSQGEKADSLYMLKAGVIKLSRLSQDGQQKVITLCGPGDIFGELIFAGDEAQALQAEVIETATVCRLDKSAFTELMRTKPDVALTFIEVISRRLTKAYRELEEMAYENAYHRLCRLLIDLCDTFQVSAAPGCLIALRVTQEDLAEMLGTSRMTIVTAIKRLRQANILFNRSGNFKLDHQRLVQEVESWA